MGVEAEVAEDLEAEMAEDWEAEMAEDWVAEMAGEVEGCNHNANKAY